MTMDMAIRKKKKDTSDEECYYEEGAVSLPKEVEEALYSVGGLEALKAGLPDEVELVEAAILFNALSDPIRLRILYSLKACDLCPCLLKNITDLADSRLSYHLGVLEGAGFVSQISRKRWRIYRLTEKGQRWLSANR